VPGTREFVVAPAPGATRQQRVGSGGLRSSPLARAPRAAAAAAGEGALAAAHADVPTASPIGTPGSSPSGGDAADAVVHEVPLAGKRKFAAVEGFAGLSTGGQATGRCGAEHAAPRALAYPASRLSAMAAACDKPAHSPLVTAAAMAAPARSLHAVPHAAGGAAASSGGRPLGLRISAAPVSRAARAAAMAAGAPEADDAGAQKLYRGGEEYDAQAGAGGALMDAGNDADVEPSPHLLPSLSSLGQAAAFAPGSGGATRGSHHQHSRAHHHRSRASGSSGGGGRAPGSRSSTSSYSSSASSRSSAESSASAAASPLGSATPPAGSDDGSAVFAATVADAAARMASCMREQQQQCGGCSCGGGHEGRAAACSEGEVACGACGLTVAMVATSALLAADGGGGGDASAAAARAPATGPVTTGVGHATPAP
jgi:hypothetical protein